LGNGWSHDPGIYPILLAGGVGIAPILFLHDKFSELGIGHHLVMGARDQTEHFLVHDPKHNILLTTDDGSLGIKGTILDGLTEILQQAIPDNICIYGCGPQPMLEALRAFVTERAIPCQIASEEVMGCGIGICQGCNVEVRPATTDPEGVNETSYKLACVDGPIFWAHELV
jgi:dihydroorotate dehydrogenase electron transfer subunit